MNKVSKDESCDEGEVYTFSLSAKTLKDQPLFKIKVHDLPVTIMVNSGASVISWMKRNTAAYPIVPSFNQVV